MARIGKERDSNKRIGTNITPVLSPILSALAKAGLFIKLMRHYTGTTGHSIEFLH
jgi:hypothetical protein